MASERRRGAFLRVMAILFGLLALSNFTKAWQHTRDPSTLGMVVFGVRFETFTSNLIIGPILGAVLAAYAYGLWRLAPWVAPLSIVYACYVPVNLVLFWYRQTGADIPPLMSMLVYLAISLTGSIGTALYLAYHRDKLG